MEQKDNTISLKYFHQLLSPVSSEVTVREVIMMMVGVVVMVLEEVLGLMCPTTANYTRGKANVMYAVI